MCDFKESQQRVCETEIATQRGMVCCEARAIVLEFKLQPRGENCALSAPINLIRIPDMRSKGETFLNAKLSAVLQPWEGKISCLRSGGVHGGFGVVVEAINLNLQ